MIIHPHNETDAHARFVKYTSGVIDEIKNGLSLNPLDNAYKSIVDQLKKSYETLKTKNSPKNIPKFDDDLLKNIEYAANDTLLVEFNAREGKIEEVDWDNEYAVILVGGVGLERGYTVKGLTVSYLSRSAGGRQKILCFKEPDFLDITKNIKILCKFI